MISPFLRFVLANPQLPWDWETLPVNPAVTLEDYLERPELPWKDQPSDRLFSDVTLDQCMDLAINHNSDGFLAFSSCGVLNHPDVTFDKIVTSTKFEAVVNASGLPGGMMAQFLSHLPVENIDVLASAKNFRFFNWGAITVNNTSIDFCDIARHPELPWVWNAAVTKGRTVLLHDLLKVKDKPLDWDRVSASKGITLDNVDAHPELPWNYVGLSKNPNLTLEYVLDRPNVDWNYYNLSLNPSVVTNYQSVVVDHPELPWDYLALSRNPNITMDDVRLWPRKWDWDALMSNTGIPVKDLVSGKLWKLNHQNWEIVSNRRDLSCDDVLSRIDGGWCLVDILKYRKFSFDDFKKIASVEWSDGLFHDENVTGDYLPASTDPWYYISMNQHLCMCDVLDNPGLPWDWTELSANPLGLKIEIYKPTRDHRDNLQSVIAELECMPAGRYHSMPAGGVEYQRQLTTLQAMYPVN